MAFLRPKTGPLRGLWFLTITSTSHVDAEQTVSVPLWGLWFLTDEIKQARYELNKWFPSPCGDYGS